VNIAGLIKKATNAGVFLHIDNGNLRFKLSVTEFPADLKADILANKAKIIAFLSRQDVAAVASEAETISPFEGDRETAPLSFSQNRLWFIDELQSGHSTNYNMAIAFDVKGPFDVKKAETAIRKIIDRHEVLRTSYRKDEGQPIQIIQKDVLFNLTCEDVSHLDGQTQQRYIESLIKADINTPFNLQRDLMIRASWLRISSVNGVLLFNIHHIASDGWSEKVLWGEFQHFYQSKSGDQKATPLPLTIQIQDYARWQRRLENKPNWQTQKQFWADYLTGIPNVHQLPLDFPRPAEFNPQGGLVIHQVQQVSSNQLTAFAAQQGSTQFMMLHAVFAILLARYSGQADIVMGTPVANRAIPELTGLIGCLVNTAVLRTQVEADTDVSYYLNSVTQSDSEVITHQSFPFEKLVEILNPARSNSYHPVFQIMFNVENEDDDGVPTVDGVSFTKRTRNTIQAQFDLSLTIKLGTSGIVLSFEYCAALFNSQTIKQMAKHFEQLLLGVVSDASGSVAELEMLTPEEKQALIFDMNKTEVALPENENVISLFERQVIATPDAVSLRFESSSLTYRQLNENANRMANRLRQQGVKSGDKVALQLPRSFELVVAIYGVLKAGAAYLPLDLTLPPNRLQYILEDAQPALLISNNKAYETKQAEVLHFDSLDQLQAWSPEFQTDTMIKGEDLAYVIYTSGSTGQPKGVLCHHLGLFNRIHWMQEALRLQTDDVVLQKTPYSFDVSVWEFTWPLMYGATLVIAKPEGHKDPEYLQQLIAREGVTTLHFVPSMLSVFLESQSHQDTVNLASLKRVICSGESLSKELEKNFFNSGCSAQLINLYGPTEAAIDVSYWFCQNDKQHFVPIGKPIQNTQLYVVNEQLQLCPVGVHGELLISGMGVAHGYLNKGELTKEKFVPHPFIDGAIAYRTGDLVRRLPDGNIDYISRIDHQVKLRGFRIELGEIQYALDQHPQVKESLVMVREDMSGCKELVAYLVTSHGADLSVTELRQFLTSSLPQYMLPGAIVFIDAFPVTANGKADRKALPAPDGKSYLQKQYRAPEGKLEEILAEAWQTLLPAQQPGRDDNFFDLGGHSLLVTKMISLLAAQGYQMKVSQLFNSPVLKDLALQLQLQKVLSTPEKSAAFLPDKSQCLAALNGAELERIRHSINGGLDNLQDIYPLTPLQHGILFHHTLVKNSDPYITVLPFTFNSRETMHQVLAALQKVVDRHDILRTSFVWNGLAEPLQLVWRQAPLSINELARTSEVSFDEQIAELSSSDNLTMDASKAPMLTAEYLLDDGSQKCVLFLKIHHLVHDNISLQIIEAELLAFLTGEEERLQEPIPFKKVFENGLVSKELSVEAKDYYGTLLSDFSEVTAPFGLTDTLSDGSSLVDDTHVLDQMLGREIRQLAIAHKISPAAIFHLAWAIVVSRCSGENDVVFGTVLSGRLGGIVGAEQMPGMFINTLPIRIDVSQQKVHSALQQIFQQIMELTRFENASLSDVQQLSSIESGTPLFTTMLNYRHNLQQNNYAALDIYQQMGIKPVEGSERSNFPFAMSVDDEGEEFILTSHIHHDIAASRITQYMVNALIGIVAALYKLPYNSEHADSAQDVSLLDINILPQQERNWLVEGANNSARVLPQGLCVHQMIEHYAHTQPSHLAILGHDASAETQSLTYAELNQKANSLAQTLIVQGVVADSLVAVRLHRSIDMMVAVLAILKAGGAYLPVDPNYPEDRQQLIIEDAKPKVILSVSDIPASDSLWQCATLNLDTFPFEQVTELNPVHVNEEHLAYVMYTSGSTGKPKGVMVEHRNLVNLAFALREFYEFTPEDRVLQFASLSFDMSVEEIFGALCNGSTLVLRNEDCIGDVRSFWDFISSHQVSAINIPTTFWHQIVAAEHLSIPRCLRQISVGGEQLNPAKIKAWYERKGHLPKLLNAYGPTECTVNVSVGDNLYERRLSIGEPIANMQMFVLDAQGALLPKGVTGELHCAGAGIVRGYLNRPELTAERFVNSKALDGRRLYKTGDLVRYGKHNSLEYLGRNDSQVKIRGYRIELSEVEAVLGNVPQIEQVAVITHKTSEGHLQLLGYYTAEAKLASDTVKQQLKRNLPDYMIPAFLIQLASFPKTPNDKIDRKALPLPSAQNIQTDNYQAPIGETESVLADAWQEVFKLPIPVSRGAHFFESGGHSLLVMQLVSQVSMRGYKLLAKDVFRYPVLLDLAKTLNSSSPLAEKANSLIPENAKVITSEMVPLLSLSNEELQQLVARVPGGSANIQDMYPLVPLQKGLLFHHMMNEYSDIYVTPMLYRIASEQHLADFISAFKQVVERHDALRTAIYWRDLAAPVQVVMRRVEIPLTYKTSESVGQHQHIIDELMSVQKQWLDVEKAPMIAMTVVQGSDETHLVIQEHHLISDHVSLDVIQQELVLALQGKLQQQPEAVPYRTFVENLNQKQDEIQGRQFFRELLSDVTEVTSAFDLADARSDGTANIELQTLLPESVTEAVNRLCQRSDINSAGLFHLAWGIAMSHWSNRDDVVFGTVLSGRMQSIAGADRLVGLCINTLPVRIKFHQKPLQQVLQDVQLQLQELVAFEHLPAMIAEEESGLVSGSPLITSLFNYRHSEHEHEDSKALIQWQETGIELQKIYDRTNYPVNISVDDLGQKYNLTFQVDAAVDVQRLSQHFLHIFEVLLSELEQGGAKYSEQCKWLLPSEEQYIDSLLSGELTVTDTQDSVSENLASQVEATAKRMPDAIAVSFGSETHYSEIQDSVSLKNQKLSYQQLNSQANQLARLLIERGVSPGNRVAVCLPRSVELVVSILAIFKAGAGYVPLDVTLPKARLKAIVDDLPACLVVTRSSFQAQLQLPVDPIRLVLLDDAETIAQKDDQADNNLELALPQGLPGYVVYTSGSTGIPKGIDMPQKALVNLLAATKNCEPELTQPRRWLQFSSIGFDISFVDIFLPLVTGGTTCLIPQSLQRDIASLVTFIHGQNLEVLNLPYAVLEAMAEYCNSANKLLPGVKLIISTAERLKVTPAIRKFFINHKHIRFSNQYGPAETHVVSAYRLNDDPLSWPELPSIGEMLAGTKGYVLDAAMRKVPHGVAGELYIGGVCVSNGYLNQPELSQQKYLDNPFLQGSKIYKTGDLVKLNTSGQLQYLGRNDELVKIRGFRIEPGEVESQISNIRGVTRVAVLPRQNPAAQSVLVAYIQCNNELNATEIRSFLRSRVPEYMIPGHIEFLTQMQLTANGKIDRKALPQPQWKNSFEAPQGDIETRLAQLWQELLNIAEIGRTDNFFMSGGHSLLATRLQYQIKQTFNLDIPINNIFEKPVLLELAAWLHEEQTVANLEHLQNQIGSSSEAEELVW
jgi:amino acid adenylation domain-containing protein